MDPDTVRAAADRADTANRNALAALGDLDEFADIAVHAAAGIAVAEQLRALRLALVDAIETASRRAR